MRWSRLKKSGDDPGLVLLIALSPLWVPAAAIAVVAVGAQILKRRLLGPTPEWRPWFAWYPVSLHWQPPAGPERAWLERVERRSAGHFCDIQYRAYAQEGQGNG